MGPLRTDMNANGNQALNCSEEELLGTVLQESTRKATKIYIFSMPFYTLECMFTWVLRVFLKEKDFSVSDS